MPINRTPLTPGTITTICDVNWENAIVNKINNLLGNATDYTSLKYAILGLTPNYSNLASILVQPGSCRDTTNTYDLVTSSIVGVSVLDSGLNGLALSTNLAGTASTYITNTFTADATTNILTFASPHGLTTGQGVIFTTTGTFPGGLPTGSPSSSTIRYVRVQSSTTVTVFTSRANAVANTSPVDITDAGTGTHSIDGRYIIGTGSSFTADFQVGDTISISGGTPRRILSELSATLLFVDIAPTETLFEQTYRRGGLAPKTWYYLYAVSDGSTNGFILSTRNLAIGHTLVDLPTGYIYYRQLPFTLRIDENRQIVPYYISAGWPYRPQIRYTLPTTFYNGSAFVTSSTNIPIPYVAGFVYTTLNLSDWVPPIAKVCDLHFISLGSLIGFRTTGVNNERTYGSNLAGYTIAEINNFLTTVNQQIDYRFVSNNNASFLCVMGYTVTEVI